ncbi:NUDIX hydrolase [Lentibacillus cibarius]|uniref:NUDIX hydrolase n=1 Tax=Lentibacillus cibarius TaxID=2583219 RepID=A0A549YL83_9BACI|nr:NUDIX hydrolase [Lentibacillus cibarius]TRM12633.1 NUDIX hydrolase [Lentibacillus cibarius]
MKEFEEKTIRTEHIYDGKIVKLQVDDVRLPDGKTSKRELIRHAGAVGVIPITKDNKIVLVRQYRKPLEKALVEIPAGKLEDGEDPRVTALRELEEETGYRADSLQFVTSFYTSPGFADEVMYLYLTKNIEPVDDAAAADEDEFVERVELTLEEAKQYVNEQKIHDAKTNYAILYLESLERM